MIILWLILRPEPTNGVEYTTHQSPNPPREEILHERLSHDINNENPYEGVEQVVPGHQIYPVVFEPYRHIKLSRSTYKVTTFIEFAPYLDSFNKFHDFLRRLVMDIRDPDKMMSMELILGRGIENKEWKKKVDKLWGCRRDVSATCGVDGECYRFYKVMCRYKQQYRAMQATATHMEKIFDQIRNEFLAAIDHLNSGDYSGQDRDKRQVSAEQHLRYMYSQVTNELYEHLEKLLEKIKEKHPEIHKKLTRHKRFGIMTWILGWGVFSNYKQIRTIKKNIDILYNQNQLQDRQIHDVANYLNLTATRVQLHDKMLYEIQIRLNRMDYELMNMQNMVQLNFYTTNIMFEMNTRVQKVQNGLVQLQNNVEQIYKYLRVMSSQEVDPIMIPPTPLREILAQVMEEMKQNPRLELPYDPQKDIYKYYPMMKITPVIVGDVLTILLTIPLVDKSLKVNLYKVHNLPAVLPKFGVASEYNIENKYLAIAKHGLYAALPDEREIQICKASQGGLCMMNQALHPVETVEWCVYALFIQDEKRIGKHCTMDFTPRKSSLAQSLDGYMWAISSMVGEKMQIRCLQEEHIVTIKPPLQIVHIGDGCEGYSPSIKIPAKNELTSQNDIQPRITFFLGFNEKYEKIQENGTWSYFDIDEKTLKELDDMVPKLTALPPMNMENLNKELGKLVSYPAQMPMWVLIIWLGIGTALIVAQFIFFAWYMYRNRAMFKVMGPLTKVLSGQPVGFEAEPLKRALTTFLGRPQGITGEISYLLEKGYIPRASSTRTVDKAFGEEAGPERGSGAGLNTLDVSRSVKKVLPTTKDRVRYAKYLDKQGKGVEEVQIL